MHTISPARRLALRGLYLFMAVGLGLVVWPSILSHPATEPTPGTAVRALLGSIGLLALIGLRYPVQMLPLLVLELLWKVVWALAYALPAWSQGRLGAYGEATLYECLAAYVLFPLILPWSYLYGRYIQAPAEPWGRQETGAERAA